MNSLNMQLIDTKLELLDKERATLMLRKRQLATFEKSLSVQGHLFLASLQRTIAMLEERINLSLASESIVRDGIQELELARAVEFN